MSTVFLVYLLEEQEAYFFDSFLQPFLRKLHISVVIFRLTLQFARECVCVKFQKRDVEKDVTEKLSLFH